MTRTRQHHVQPKASGTLGAVHHKRTEAGKKSSYKIVFEEIAGKKKLKVLTSKFHHEELSREVHRIGYHFPSAIVDQACMTLGITLTTSGRVVQSNFAFTEDPTPSSQNGGQRQVRKRQKGRGRNESPSFDTTLSQAVIDTQAREAIRDLFPNIPRQDLHDIIGRAFQKGKGLVGTSGDLSLVRRAQLAVTAHIRHVYTDYDRMLKSIKWADARAQVQQRCLDVLVQWRGDDDDDGEIDDILQEVIVIPDDEEDHMQVTANSTMDHSHGRKTAQSIRRDVPNGQNNKRGAMGPEDHDVIPESSDSDEGNAVQYLGARTSLHSRPFEGDQRRFEHIGAQRQRIWDEAVDRRRKVAQSLPIAQSHHSLPSLAEYEQSDNLSNRQHITRLQRWPYPDESGQPTSSQDPVHTRLIPLPPLTTYQRGDYRTSPRHSKYIEEESRSYVENEPQSSQSYSRITELSGARYNTNYDLHHFRSKDQRPATQLDNKNVRSVTHQYPFEDTTVNAGTWPAGEPSHYQAEVILPSIEDGPSNSGNMVSAVQNQLQSEASSAYPHGGSVHMSHGYGHHSRYVLGEEEARTKGRNVRGDDQWLNSEPQRTILIPLDQQDGNVGVFVRPTETMSYRDRAQPQPSILDERIVQLPPKGLRQYNETYASPRMISYPQPSMSQISTCLPISRLQDQCEYLDHHRQPDPPNHSILTRSAQSHQYPVVPDGSQNLLHRDTADQRLPFNRGDDRGDDNRYFSNSEANTMYPRHSRDEQMPTPTYIRDPTVDAGQLRALDMSNTDRAVRDETMEVHSQGNRYISHPSLRPSASARSGSYNETFGPRVHDTQAQDRCVQHGSFQTDRSTAAGDWTSARAMYNMPQSTERVRMNPLRERQNITEVLPAEYSAPSHSGLENVRMHPSNRKYTGGWREVPEDTVVLE